MKTNKNITKYSNMIIDNENEKSYFSNITKHFKGDIIITDPCYVMKEKDWPDSLENIDWGNCVYNPEQFGITNFIASDTLYGDWSCGTYKLDNIGNSVKYSELTKKNEIGGFCADAGLVGVFLLDDVLKYNPNIEYKDNWCKTYIKDFDGDVSICLAKYDKSTDTVNIIDTKGYYELDGNYIVVVVGKGNINFIGIQAGL